MTWTLTGKVRGDGGGGLSRDRLVGMEKGVAGQTGLEGGTGGGRLAVGSVQDPLLLPPLTPCLPVLGALEAHRSHKVKPGSEYPTSLPTSLAVLLLSPVQPPLPPPQPGHPSQASSLAIWGSRAPLPEACPQLPTPSYSAIVWPSARLQWLVYKRRVLFSHGQCNKFLDLA